MITYCFSLTIIVAVVTEQPGNGRSSESGPHYGVITNGESVEIPGVPRLYVEGENAEPDILDYR